MVPPATVSSTAAVGFELLSVKTFCCGMASVTAADCTPFIESIVRSSWLSRSLW